MKRVSIAMASILLVSACLGSDFADSVEGPWQMTTGTVDGEEIPLIASHPITINFEGGQVHGTAACNGYGGTFLLSGSEISISGLSMTEMACSPEETMRAEAMFAMAIPRVDTAGLDRGLTLTGPGVELVFEALDPVPDAELTGAVWILDGLVAGDAVSSTPQGSLATIELSSDGTVSGNSGCRPFSGHYMISGAEVIMTELTAEGHECEPHLADQDNLFFSVVGDGFRVEIAGNRLTMWSRGDEGLTFVAEG